MGWGCFGICGSSKVQGPPGEQEQQAQQAQSGQQQPPEDDEAIGALPKLTPRLSEAGDEASDYTKKFASMKRKSAAGFAERMKWEEPAVAPVPEDAGTAAAAESDPVKSEGEGDLMARFKQLVLDFKERKQIPVSRQDSVSTTGSDSARTNSERLKKPDVLLIFQKLGFPDDQDLVDKLFLLFQSVSGGLDLEAFAVIMCTLSDQELTKSDEELAFKLFDADHNNAFSPGEFDEMISCLIGNKLSTLLSLEDGHACFEEFLKSEFSSELLEFLDELDRLHADGTQALPATEAEALFAKYLEVGSMQQVNVSDDVRESLRAQVAAAQESGAEVSLSAFDTAIKETKTMIEQGPLLRFKAALQAPSDTSFSKLAWVRLGLPADYALSLAEFTAWAESNRSVFSVFSDLRKKLQCGMRIAAEQVVVEQRQPEPVPEQQQPEPEGP